MEEFEKKILDRLFEELEEERFTVSGNMIKHGGGFVRHLGAALARADLHNSKKIKETWPEYWKTYKNWGH